jgi:decaprenyl-phosphate phosphoribosyltransferase
MRPRQWIKNLLIVAAAGAAGALGHDDVPGRLTLTFAAFCLISGGVYALNDVHDRRDDRLHPVKCRRPVAAGALSPAAAVIFGLCLIALGVLVCVALRPLLAVVALGYVALTLSYTFVWREKVVLDVVAISGGFVLRAVAGGVAAPVTLSRWFLVVVSAASVLLAVGKRHAEMRRTRASGARPRTVIAHYSPRLLIVLLLTSATTALFAYIMWALAIPTVNGIPWRLLTVVPFALCLVRYGTLVRRGAGESPEDLILSDHPLAFAGVVWLIIFALGVHAAG